MMKYLKALEEEVAKVAKGGGERAEKLLSPPEQGGKRDEVGAFATFATDPEGDKKVLQGEGELREQVEFLIASVTRCCNCGQIAWRGKPEGGWTCNVCHPEEAH